MKRSVLSFKFVSFKWRVALVALLMAICLSVMPANAQSTTMLTPGLDIATAGANSTVSAGSRSATFVTSSDFSGTILGKGITGSAPGGGLTWAVPADHTQKAIPYTVTAGTLYILTER
jgi:hypothetical protein